MQGSRLNLAKLLLVGVVLQPIAVSGQGDGRGIGIGAAEPAGPPRYAPVAGKAPANNAGLFVGVNTFAVDQGLRSLNFAVNDAIAQAHLFVLELKLVSPGNCYLALSGQPTSERVKEQLAALEKAGIRRVSAGKSHVLRTLLVVERIPADESDLLVVSISSHGFEERGVPYAMPSDGLRSMLADTAINILSVERRLAESKAGKRLLLLDACRERPAAEGKGGDGSGAMTAAFRDALARAAGQAVLASCDAGQVSYENPELGHGVFTHFLIRGMRGHAVADNRGFITLGSVSDYIARSVRDWMVRNKPGIDRDLAQRPWFKGPNDARDIPLAIDPGTRDRRARFKADVSKVIEDLKRKINRRGKFGLDLYGRLADALEQSEDDDHSRDLLANVRDFTAGRILENVFAAYLEQVLESLAERAARLARGDTFTNSTGMKLIYITGGEFLMGSPAGEEDRDSDETQHRVRLTKGFFMGVTEVTQLQWKAVMGSNRSQFKGDDLPVGPVSWNDVMKFCRKLSQKESRTYRLPMEAEWEYACRAGTTTPFNTGRTISTYEANYAGNHVYGNGRKGVYRAKTTPVGNFRPNRWGLYDMHGNVLEWCSDWYGKEYPRNLVIDPAGPRTGTSRVVRGGSWDSRPRYCRSAFRYGIDPVIRHRLIGFRVVCSVRPGLAE